MPETAIPIVPSLRRAAFAILFGAAAMFALNPGGREYGVRDVVRYAQMAFEMHHAGAVVPTLQGRPYHEAMPLAAWAPCAVAAIQGEVTPATARVLPAAAGIALAAAILLFVLRHGGPREALLAAAFVSLNELVVVHARCSRIDVPLAFAVTAAVGAFFHGAVTGRGLWYAVSGLGLGLAVAAKGPMAALLVGAAVLPWAAWERRWRALLGGTAIALAVAAAVTAAWLVPYLRVLGPEGSRDFYEQMILHETVDKAEAGYGKAAPAWAYLVWAATRFGPWIAATVAGLWAVLRARGGARPLDRLAVCWMAGPFLLLSLAAGKSPRYLLPLIPAMAILAAPAFDRWVASAAARAPWATRTALASLGLLVQWAALAAPLLPASRGAPALYAWGTALAAAVAGGAAVDAALRGRPRASLLGLYVAASCLVAFFFAAVLATPAVEQALEVERFEDPVAEVVPRGASLAIAEEDAPGHGEGINRFEVGLYMGRWIDRASPTETPSGFVIAQRAPPDRPVVRTVRWGPGGVPWVVLGPVTPVPTGR